MKILDGKSRLAGRTRTIPRRVDERFGGGLASAERIDRRGLRRELERTVEGEVRFDTSALALYSTDASNYRQVPIGVVIPRTLDDVVAAHRACAQFGAPILSRGGGTSLSGETVNNAVVIDHSKYLRRILEIDPKRRLVTVENGAVNERVNEALGPHGLVFAPDPSTHAYCTIGGNVGNNSCGVHSVQAQFAGDGGRTSDNVEALDVVLYDGTVLTVGRNEEERLDEIVAAGGRKGEIYAALRDLRERYADLVRERYPDIPRRVSGYNLDELLPEKGFNVARALVGTEGTCVTVRTATLNLVPNPAERVLLVVSYRSAAEAGDHVPAIMGHRPMGLEGIDERLYANEERMGRYREGLAQLPEGNAWLLVEFGGESAEEAEEQARALRRALEKDEGPPEATRLVTERRTQRLLWEVREAGLGATAFPSDDPRDHWPGWEDSAVPPEKLGAYIRELEKLYDEHGYVGAFYGHYGQGCIHSRIDFELRTAEGLRRFRSFMEAAADLVVSFGGSLSGEHGDGQARAELLDRMFGPELVEAFREFKRIWDPDWKMNPGKVVDPYRLDEHLKLGVAYNPARPRVEFAYAEDGGDFAHAALRCVGIGKCRVAGGVDVMCPSYIVTREEKHSTRGRARLLFEMLRGEVVTDGWRSEEVYDALDLCLACKGCTNDCPVSVDMPTYKAEFLHHHWARRLRPRHAYAFGLVDQAARIASRAPGAVNFLTGTQPFAAALKRLAGMTPEREIPAFAPLTLQQWFRERGGARNPDGRRVLLWPDTFNNHFHTEVGVAAVEALEAAGYRVVLPEGHVCCGRPLYDYGFLHLARRYFHRTLERLRDEIRAGTPIVGVEPSCVAAFKDELTKLLPDDDDARRLSGAVHHLGEFLLAEDVELPRLEGKALLWGHCHQKATGGMGPELALLRGLGLEVEEVTGGCCGLAGSWGFEEGHYEISMACGEHALLPAVRDLEQAALVVANGFSCKTQIEAGGGGRRALHLAEVLALARKHGGSEPGGVPPEARLNGGRPEPRFRRKAVRAGAVAGLGALTLVGGAAALTGRRRR